MPKARTSAINRIVVVTLIALFAWGMRGVEAVAADPPPAAPTISDAHQYFESLVSGNDVSALYETNGRNGDFLGYDSFPVHEYWGAACNSGITLKNGVKIGIDWTVVDKTQISDGTLNMHAPNVPYKFFHMVSLEGGLVVEPSNNIPRLTFAINDELSRNRLLKAVGLLSTACREKSKFD